MKRVLVDYRGLITDVVDFGNEFEVYDGEDSPIRWVTCDHDDVKDTWILTQGKWVKPEDRLEGDQNLKRRIAYGPVEDQLDMMYKDMLDGGSRWVDHVSNIKSSIPSKSQWEEDPLNFEGKVEVILHDINDPAWNYLPKGSIYLVPKKTD